VQSSFPYCGRFGGAPRQNFTEVQHIAFVADLLGFCPGSAQRLIWINVASHKACL
jgi:hypothetical protein